MTGTIRIGISGWTYPPWRGRFYPKGVAQARLPEGFVFAVKASRNITHTRRLNDVATPLANFFASGLLNLGPKLGQFPFTPNASTPRCPSPARLEPELRWASSRARSGDATCLIF